MSNIKVKRMSYCVDLVLCIDATEGMSNVIDQLKYKIPHLLGDVNKRCMIKGKYIDTFRIKLIFFRDFIEGEMDGNAAMKQTEFLKLPERSEYLHGAIELIEAIGGGDDLEDGLEALAMAMKSKWNDQKGVRHRHVIVIWSDEGTHDIGFGSKASSYPKGMPKDFSELTKWWGSKPLNNQQTSEGQIMNEYAKRLVLFVPEKKHWTLIDNGWNRTIAIYNDKSEMMDRDRINKIYDMLINEVIHNI